MELRKKTNKQICEENNCKPVLTNVVEEESAKNRIRAVLQQIAKFLCASLGPYGSTTIIQDRERRHTCSKDGFDIMNRLNFEDDTARTILDIVRSVSRAQVRQVGDGSTSAVVVANALYSAINSKENREKLKQVAPKDIVDILLFIEKKMIEYVKAEAKPISDDFSELEKVAYIATNNDVECGRLMKEVYQKIGKYGFVTTDYEKAYDEDYIEYKEGIEWDTGTTDSRFFIGNEDKKIVYKNARIWICNSTLTAEIAKSILSPMIKQICYSSQEKLLIVARSATPEVLQFLADTRNQHRSIQAQSQGMPELDFTYVEIPLNTKLSVYNCEDLALLCGCDIFDPSKYRDFDEAYAKHKLYEGKASKIIITERKVEVLSETSDNTKAKTERIKHLQEEIMKLEKKQALTDDEIEKVYNNKVRIGHLSCNTAVYHVGGSTIVERMTRERLIEDAIFACKSALKFGIIPGGNLFIPYLINKEEVKEKLCEDLTKEFRYICPTGPRVFFDYFLDLVSDSLLEVFRNVLANAELDTDDIDKIIERCVKKGQIYNLKTKKYEKFIDTLVINSADTDLQILKSCVSIIGILATSNQVLTLNLNTTDFVK